MRRILNVFIFIAPFIILSCSSAPMPEQGESAEISDEVAQLEDDLSESGEIDDLESDESFDSPSEEVASSEEAGDLEDFSEDSLEESPQESSDEVAQSESNKDPQIQSAENDEDFSDLEEGNFDEVAPLEDTSTELAAAAGEEESLEPLEETSVSTTETAKADDGFLEGEAGGESKEEDPLTAEERQFKGAFGGPPVEISDISYLANESGGAVLIKVDSDFYFKTRSNIETKQYIIEIANANLPQKLKRPYIMKEFKASAFGAINAYQKSGSSIARVVLQMKEAKDPIIQKEGNTLLIIPATNEPPANELAEDESQQKLNEAEGLQENLALEAEKSPDDLAMNIDYSKGGTPEAYPKYEMAEETKNLLLSARTLDEFLIKHRKYYGKPISIQVENSGIKDVLEMIGEEAGLNLALPEELGGNITLKLRKVPWDQAFILILKQNNLGYVREGNVIRIDSLQKLQQEVNYAQQVIENRYNVEPLQIKILPVSYTQLADAVTKLTALKTTRGSVIADVQTNAVIVTDVEDSIIKMEKLLEAIDVPPRQVLIEGKIIEAIESFSQGMGINWTASGGQKTISDTGGVGGSPLTMNPSLSISPVDNTFGGIATFGINVGVLDVIGTLNAQIALLEDNNLAKVISSPRIITLSGEQAQFTQTVAVPFVNSETQAGGPQGVTTIQTNSTQDFTLSFNVTPVITSDNSIRLDLNVNRTNPASGTVLNGQVTTSTSATQTKVLVGNNQTAVIGGIYAGSETSTVKKVPVLGNIPILGWLFKSKATENTKTELMIFVTPRILTSNFKDKSPMAKKVDEDSLLEERISDESKSL